jgi:hypothetical protein
MNPRAKQAWLLNAGLAVLFLAAAIFVRQMSRPALAAGGGWDTNGIMANTTENDTERLVLVDTLRKNIMVYKTDGPGVFRLMSARSYRYDHNLPGELGDTSKLDDVEKRGGVSFMKWCEILYGAKRP